MLITFLAGSLAGLAIAVRPNFEERLSKEEPAGACFLKKGGKDGVGHQLFGLLSVMGAHGVTSETGICYVYNAAPRDFSFQHMEEQSPAWLEADALMKGFYEDFAKKVGAKGCATEELVSRSVATRVPTPYRPRYLWQVQCDKDTDRTWEIDNVWYGSDHGAYDAKQISSPTPFMRAVIKNATQLAALAAQHLPPSDVKPALAVHMRFGDRATALTPVAAGQQAFFKSYDSQQLSPAHVFSDDASEAKHFLSGTALADATFWGPERATAIQAMAGMLAAETFVGSRSDISSSVAMMRIGLGKRHTFMPETWHWAAGFSKAELSLYPEADHHHERCRSQCDDDGAGKCVWCGRRQTGERYEWMYCCRGDHSYAPDHKCRGAAFNPDLPGEHQCVTRGIMSRPL